VPGEPAETLTTFLFSCRITASGPLATEETMIQRETRKWYWLGFAITAILALVFLAITRAPAGRAQEGPQTDGFSNRPANEAAAENSDTLIGEAAIRAAEAAAEYSSPMTIPAADFVSDGVNPSGFRFILLDSDGRGGYLRGTLDPDTCLSAPVYLPDGATMTNMTATVVDSDSLNRIVVTLRRANKDTGFPTTIGVVSTTSDFSSSNLQDIGTNNITGPLVENDKYGYFVTTCLPAATIHLYAVRVFYSQ
jgi:hypothetical protein